MSSRLLRFRVGEQTFVALRLHRRPEPGALTATEREIARLVAAGWSNAQIARERGTSARTVANQLASIYRKLGISSRVQLAARSA